MTCTCPAGQTTDRIATTGAWTDRHGVRHRKQAFRFDGGVCDGCALRAQCTRGAPGRGRTVALHPQERLLQEARELQSSPQFGQYKRMRQAVEHRLARLVQSKIPFGGLGIRQARYFGCRKTLFQAQMAAAVANLTLVAGKTAEMGASTAQRLLRFIGRDLKHAVGNPLRAFQRHIRQMLIRRQPSILIVRKSGFRPGL